MNEDRTCANEGTNLTQAGSLGVHGWTYFVQRKDMLIKIGFTEKPRHRIATLRRQFGRSLKTLAVVPSAVAGEYETHQQFDHLRAEGEWFKPAADLWKFIRRARKLGAEYKPPRLALPKPTPIAVKLTAWRRQHGHDSAIGNRCSNLLEAIPIYQSASDPQQKANIAKSIAGWTAALSGMLKNDIRAFQ